MSEEKQSFFCTEAKMRVKTLWLMQTSSKFIFKSPFLRETFLS